MAGSTGVAAAVARARRRVISYFMAQNAVTPEKAIAFVSDRRLEQRMFDRFVAAKVIVWAEGGRYYLDVPAWDDYARKRRRRVGLVMGALAAGAAAVVALVA